MASDKGRSDRHGLHVMSAMDGRLRDTARRYVELDGQPTSRRYPVELIAASIRRHDGNVWPAIVAFDLSYRHATRIRAGWRPGSVR